LEVIMSNELTTKNKAEPVESKRWIQPLVDVYENEDEWLIAADVPGATQEGLELHLDKNELTIEARRADEDKRLPYAGFRRLFTLPSGVDGEKVSAELQNGVVSIHLPKSAAIKPRQIQVQVG
jgi:HSP20 family protein